jgi:hypothetical protein
MSPFVHEMGDPPPRQVSSHGLVSLQDSRHGPVHSTTQVVTLLQVIVLAGPARTPQRSTLSHRYWQFAPQKAPHETVLWQSIVQSSPHAEEQSLTSWHSSRQPSPHTPPQ